MLKEHTQKLFRTIATVFGIGYLPLAPGTWASAAGLGVYTLLPSGGYIGLIAIFIITFILGIVSSNIVEADFGQKDPPQIVIDEFSCIFAAFLFVKLTLPIMIIGFILYRTFDIIKIPPMKQLEKLKGGWGIMLDDLAAAIYTNLILQIVSRLI